MVFYTKNDIIDAFHLKFCAIFPSETYRFNKWMSKNKHFHLSILKLNQQDFGQYEKIDQIMTFMNILVIAIWILMKFITLMFEK